MPLLCELFLTSGEKKLSNEWYRDVYMWNGYIINASPLGWMMSTIYGGCIKPDFGEIEFLVEAFNDDWLPDRTAEIHLYWTDSTEANKITLFTGTAHLKDKTRTSVIYEIFENEYSDTESGVVYNDTLENIGAAYAATLGLTFVNSSGRVVSPTVKYTTPSEPTPIILNFCDMCSFFTHWFYIDNDDSKMYFGDMLLDNGTGTLDEFDFNPLEYRDKEAHTSYIAGNYSVLGTDNIGDPKEIKPVCQNSKVTIEAALDDIKTVHERSYCTMRMPLTESVPLTPGKALTWIDESFLQDINANMRIYGFNIEITDSSEDIILELGGSLT